MRRPRRPVASGGAAVYWVGLPRMRSAGAEAGAELVNGIFEARAAEGGYPFIDTMAATSDANQDYAAYLPSGPDGGRQLVRASDGVHMTMNGYTILTQGLARHLKTRVATLRAQAARLNARQASSAAPGAATSG